jgi:hypothetical protein
VVKRERELKAREYEIERRDLVQQIDEAKRQRNPQGERELMYELAALDTRFQQQYTRSFAEEHGVDPSHPELQKTRNRSEFEATVYRLEAEQARQELEQTRKKLKSLQGDIPATVAAEVQKQLAKTGVSNLDAGAGSAGGKVSNWLNATPEQVRRMEEELQRRR